jgi:hypothetical protein
MGSKKSVDCNSYLGSSSGWQGKGDQHNLKQPQQHTTIATVDITLGI